MFKIDNKLMLFWYYARNGRAFLGKKLSYKICLIVRACFFTIRRYKISGNGQVLFYMANPRKDLLEYFMSIFDSCDLEKCFAESEVSYGFTLQGLLSMIKCFGIYKNNNEVIISTYKKDGEKSREETITIPFWGRIYLWAYFAGIYRITSSIINECGDLKGLVVLNDSMAEEGVFVEMAKRHNNTTVCCQEGFFVDDPNNRIILQTHYLSPTSDYYVVWGEYTKKLFMKYNSDYNIYIGGNPALEVVDGLDSTPIERWCVIFDVPSLSEYNQQLINIVTNVAISYNKKIDIRLHPQERETRTTYDIDKNVCSFEYKDLVYERYFAHSSSMIYTMMAQGFSIFVLITDYSKVLPREGLLTFTDEDSLINMINTAETMKNGGESYIKYVGKEARNRYNELFNVIFRRPLGFAEELNGKTIR